MKRILLMAVAISLAALPAAAQTAPAGGGANPLSASLKRMFDGVKRNISEAAEKVPEDLYSFKPTPDVRSFGGLVGHLANGNYSYCSAAKGDKNPNAGNDFEKKTAKADLVKGLKDAIAYCDGIYLGATDQMVMELIKVGQPPNQMDAPRAQPLITNISHDNEHYGNIVTYMRLKGMVPPSTERAQQPRRP